jgi:hypothetical protein
LSLWDEHTKPVAEPQEVELKFVNSLQQHDDDVEDKRAAETLLSLKDPRVSINPEPTFTAAERRMVLLNKRMLFSGYLQTVNPF